MARRSHAEPAEESVSPLHPKLNEQLIGHAAIEKQLLKLIVAKRLPHALLLTGPRGIGKATLAYHLARFLLKPDEASGGLFGEALPPESLHIPASHPTFKRVNAGSHTDFLVLEADNITVEEARKVGDFLSLTPGEGEWRMVIIDSADAMNRAAANALLKILEEPPAQTVLILVSHNPGSLLPTIRSRCRTMRMHAPSETEFARIMATIMPGVALQDYQHWGVLSGYSPGVALALMEAKADAMYQEITERISTPDTLKLHAFAEKLGRKDSDAQWQVFARLLLWLLSRIAAPAEIAKTEIFSGEHAILERLHRSKPLDAWTELWEKTRTWLFDTERLNLERKQAVITLLRAASE